MGNEAWPLGGNHRNKTTVTRDRHQPRRELLAQTAKAGCLLGRAVLMFLRSTLRKYLVFDEIRDFLAILVQKEYRNSSFLAPLPVRAHELLPERMIRSNPAVSIADCGLPKGKLVSRRETSVHRRHRWPARAARGQGTPAQTP